jgi:hypothetical protein
MALVLITGTYTYFASKQAASNITAANAAKDAAETASDTLKYQQAADRPWVGPTNIGGMFNISDPAKRTIGFWIGLLDAGRSPATGVAIDFKWLIGPPLPEQGDPKTIPRNLDCDNGPLPQGHLFLVPNVPLTRDEGFPPDVLANFEEITANNRGLYLVGCIDYFGPSGKDRYRTSVSQKFISAHGKLPYSLQLTDTGNDAC